MKNNTVFVKGNLKVHIRWANVTDASNIARLELNASHYENRREPFTFTHPQFTALWENRLSDEIIGQCLLVVQKSLWFLNF